MTQASKNERSNTKKYLNTNPNKVLQAEGEKDETKQKDKRFTVFDDDNMNYLWLKQHCDPWTGCPYLLALSPALEVSDRGRLNTVLAAVAMVRYRMSPSCVCHCLTASIDLSPC